MSNLTATMSHEAAASHLRQEVMPTARYETGRLVNPDSPAFFGAARAVMCDLDYVAALYCGWDGSDVRRIATRANCIRFLTEVVAAASGRPAYGVYAAHLYDTYRVGTVHLRTPKQLENLANSPPLLSWALMFERTDSWDLDGVTLVLEHLVPAASSTPPARTVLPLSIGSLFEDFLLGCEYFAGALDAEQVSRGRDLIERWNTAAGGLTRPMKSKLSW